MRGPVDDRFADSLGASAEPADQLAVLVGELGEPEPARLALVAEHRGGQRRQQHVGEVLGAVVDARLAQQQRHVRAVEGVDRAGQPAQIRESLLRDADHKVMENNDLIIIIIIVTIEDNWCKNMYLAKFRYLSILD